LNDDSGQDEGTDGCWACHAAAQGISCLNPLVLSRAFLILIAVLSMILAILACSCATTETPIQQSAEVDHVPSGNVDMPTIDHCWFEQVLLRDAATELSRSSGFSITLSDEVNKIDNLAIDSSNMSGKRLDEILDQVTAYLNKHWKLSLYWERHGHKGVIIRIKTIPVSPGKPST
jgi:hypothetical protein